MRNLKRALSLALAFVMVMSLMIVGTSAKSYTDADKIDNQVAVEILGEIGVMIGNDDGSFAPDRDVTRAEMAVIITRILYGNNMNVDQFKDMNTFTDVPDWAEGFVNLCASLDIIAGRGNGIFDPDATVTTAEAALMLSRALGYFKNNAEFGNDWALAAMKRATQAGIIGGDMVLQANAGLDRDDVAQMTFNTLTNAVPVQYNELLDVYYNENQGIIYALEFNYLQTLGFTNFGLVYKTNEQTVYGRPATTWGIGSYKDAGSGTASGIEKAELTDQGGLIASNVRMLDKDQIITVANTPDYVYTKDTAEKDVYTDLGATLCNDAKGQKASEEYDWTAFINGKEVKAEIPEKNESGDYTYTDKGAVVEIYVDDYDQTVTVVEINYYLGEISKVNEDKGTVTVKELSPQAKLNDDTFATTEYAKGDYVVFTVDFNDDDDYYICEMMAPETVTGDVTRVQNENVSKDTYIRLDNEDTKYYYTNTTTHMAYDVTDDNDSQHPTLNEEYILYMTPAGYVLGFKPTAESVDQYLYIMDSDENLRDWNAKVVLPDATQPKVDLDDELDNVGDAEYPFLCNGTAAGDIGNSIDWIRNNSSNVKVTDPTAGGAVVANKELDLSNVDFLIWNYSVNSSDVYSLEYVPYEASDAGKHSDVYQSRMYDAEIFNGKAYITEGKNDLIVDKQTIFVDTMNDVAYTGYNEVPNIKNAKLAYVVEDKVAEIVYILGGEIYDENATFFALTDTARETGKDDDVTYWEYENAYVDGKNESQFVTYKAVSDLANALTKAGENPEDYLAKGDKQHDDADRWILKAGVLYKAVQTIEDGQYISKLEVVALGDDYTNGFVKAVGDDAFWIGAKNKEHKFDTDSETIFVTCRQLLDVNGNFDEYVIDDGDINDLKAISDTNTTIYGDKYVWVVKDVNDNTARLVYICWTETVKGDKQTITFKGDNFTVAPVGTTQNEGSNVLSVNDKGMDAKFTVTPDAGYDLVSVVVNGKTLTANKNGVYTIENVTKNMTVTVTATKKVVSTTEVLIVGDKIYTANEDSNLMLVGQAIEKALIAEGYTDVSYTIEDGKIQKISAKNGSATVNFKYGDEISSNDVAYLGNGESIADAISDGAKTVYLTDGTFQMDAQVTGDLTIIGDDDTVITSASGNAIDIARGADANVVIENVTIESAANKYGINANASAGDLILNNVTFKGGKIGVQADGMVNVTIEGCTFEGCTKVAISLGDGITGTITLNNNSYDLAESAVAVIEYDSALNSADFKGNDVAKLGDQVKPIA